MRPERRASRFVQLLTALTLMSVVTSVVTTAVAADTATDAQPPEYGPSQSSIELALLYSLAHPHAYPAGTNDPRCRVNGEHPVVLVNATGANSYVNWSRLAPQLRSDGRCVFAFEYGDVKGSPLHQVGPMRESARQLAAFVDGVLAATGAPRVDLVGASQGGLLPLYYINRLHGDAKVGRMVGIEPASQGASENGVQAILGGTPGLNEVPGVSCAACVDFTVGSSFLRETAEGGWTRPGVRYTTIVSRTDLAVTVDEARLPPAPNVTNIITQDICPQDLANHTNSVYDDITLRIARNALDPAHAVAPRCHPVLPLLPPQL
ncbi:esterase/lipase family protein [Streptomyces sp. NPDC002537]